MIVVITALAAAVAFIVLTRRYWRAPDGSDYNTWLTLATLVLVLGLAMLAATGRLHWIAAVVAAIVPFLRRILGLLRYAPLLGSVLGRRDGSAGEAGRDRPGARRGGPMTRADALDILGLGPQPSRDEVIAAHRRLVQRLHPDRGGSTYLTAQLNAAKERLLADL